MSHATPAIGEVEVLRRQTGNTGGVVRRNIEGVTHEESLRHPEPGGNSMNWVVGHLMWVYDRVLPRLGQEIVMPKDALQRYARGGPPLTDPADALPFADLAAAWDTASARMDAGLASLKGDALDQRVADSPSGDPNETIRSLLATVCFHQAYHAGQTGVLRRVSGKPGAIK